MAQMVYGESIWSKPQIKKLEEFADLVRADKREQALAAPTVQEPAGCQHKRYSVDAREGTGTCHDCGAEGRMQFVVGDTNPLKGK